MDSEIISTVLRYVKSTYLPEKRHNPKFPDSFTSGDIHFFAPAVADMSAAFTFERGDRHANYFSTKEARSSYLLYFLIPNMLKVEWILKQQRMAELFASESEVRIADIGCGPCTGLLAAVQHWKEFAPQQKLKLVAVDQNGPMLKDGKNILDLMVTGPVTAGNPVSAMAATGPHPAAPPVITETIVANITTSELRKKLSGKKFHVLILANVLNEFKSMEERYNFTRTLMENYLEPNGRLIIVEPALQRATRDLMTLRDEMVLGYDGQTAIAQVLAPCLHQALCPMRANNPRDWCHTYINWERPQIIADLDMLIGNKKDYLKMSYMVMKHASGQMKLEKTIWRVVSAPMKSKGKIEILFCGQNGKLLRVTRQDKDRSKFNIALDNIQRGDIVDYAGGEKCGRETIVTGI